MRKGSLLADARRGVWLVKELVASAVRHAFALVAYCAMPNHLHFLAMGKSPSSDLVKFVSPFKQKTGFEYQRRFGRRLWQPKYYEHILRGTEELEGVALYIWNNPVRARICGRAVDYPLSGSLTLDWKARYRSLGEWRPPWRTGDRQPGPECMKSKEKWPG
jgi:REP element-mobilizing transposase RayT